MKPSPDDADRKSSPRPGGTTDPPPAPRKSATATAGSSWRSSSPCRSAGARHFAGLGPNITLTTRARRNAVFHHPTPAASGKRGRPRLRGDRIGTPTDIARNATDNNTWSDTLINRYGTTITVRTTEITGLWFGVWRTDPVRVILVKDSHRKTTTNKDFDIAIVTP